MPAPILFCHYGDSEYLRYTLACARHRNPEAAIYLLGDASNARTARRSGVVHQRFAELEYGERLGIFDAVYRLVQGPRHQHLRGGRDWVNFVFRRWFYVFNFVVRQRIGAFWHFDSDTMLVEALHEHEPRLAAYDHTEQCGGHCMNGYISRAEVLGRYLDKINELFRREEYLRRQQEEFDTIHPRFAYTEMRAYQTFKHEERLRAVRLAEVVEGSTFDDAIGQSHGMKMESLPAGRAMKRVYLGPAGTFWCERQDGTLVRMNSLNLSWMPIHVFHHALAHARTGRPDGRVVLVDPATAPTLASRPLPLRFTVRALIARGRSALRRLIASTEGRGTR